MSDEELVGKEARVTLAVGSTSMGEVSVAVRGGTERYMAYSPSGTHFQINDKVQISEFNGGRVVGVKSLTVS